MNEALHIDRIAEAGVAWESAVKSYVRTWGRPADDGVVTPAEWRASEAERAARSAYEAARDEYRLHLLGDPHDEAEPGSSDRGGLQPEPEPEPEPEPQPAGNAWATDDARVPDDTGRAGEPDGTA